MWGGKLEERNGEVENVVGFLASSPPPSNVKNKEIENEDETISISR